MPYFINYDSLAKPPFVQLVDYCPEAFDSKSFDVSTYRRHASQSRALSHIFSTNAGLFPFDSQYACACISLVITVLHIRGIDLA